MNQIDITITNYPDQAQLVAERWCELGLWGEIRFQEATQPFALELFPLADGQRPSFDVAALETAIAKAKRRLLEIQGLPLPQRA